MHMLLQINRCKVLNLIDTGCQHEHTFAFGACDHAHPAFEQDFSMTHARLTTLQPESCLSSFCSATSTPEHPSYLSARRAAA